jgi:ATP-dependent Lon protease
MGTMTGRNQDAIKKTTAGLMKLLYPHRDPDSITHEEVVPLLEVAVEMRKRVTDQLAKLLPAEFSDVEYTYTLKR